MALLALFSMRIDLVAFTGLASSLIKLVGDRFTSSLLLSTLLRISGWRVNCQGRYAALLLLRMMQSLGASATVAIGYGVVADVATAAERGRVLGPAMVGESFI